MFLYMSAFSLLKETLSTCVSYISMNGPCPGAQQSGLVMGFYTARYIVGMFVTGFPNEAR
jgi:hypothetical protein